MKTKPKIEYITDFKLCDKNHFLIVKGISILLVILAHFFDQYLNIPQLLPLQGVAASVFLLCSGYGVSESFKNKNGLPHYWENKALKVWLPSLAIVVFFSAITEGGAFGWVAENPLALHGWFLYLLFAEYLAFWLVFYYLENKNIRLLVICAISLCIVAVTEKREVATQVVCFPAGVLFSQLGAKYTVRQMKPAGRALLCVLLAAMATGAYWMTGYFSQPLLQLVSIMLFDISAAALLCLGVYFAQAIKVFGVFAPLGTISYALYLLHEGVLTLLTGRTGGHMLTAVLIGLLVISAVFTLLCQLLVEWNKKLRRRKKTQLKGSMW